MAQTLERDRAAHANGALRPPRRPLLARLSRGHVLALVAALVAAALNVAALRAADARIEVLALREDVPAGAPVTSSSVRTVRLAADDAVTAVLMRPADLMPESRLVAISAMSEGALLRHDDVQATGDSGGLRAMSVAVDTERAVGGALAAGDLVDVITVRDGEARYLLAGVSVLAVPGTAERGALGGLGAFHVTLAVDDVAALDLAEATATGNIHLVRASGAPEVPPDLLGARSRPGPGEDGTEPGDG